MRLYVYSGIMGSHTSRRVAIVTRSRAPRPAISFKRRRETLGAVRCLAHLLVVIVVAVNGIEPRVR